MPSLPKTTDLAFYFEGKKQDSRDAKRLSAQAFLVQDLSNKLLALPPAHFEKIYLSLLGLLTQVPKIPQDDAADLEKLQALTYTKG
jgi:hypothetical protein